jgi:hypothetical protein
MSSSSPRLFAILLDRYAAGEVSAGRVTALSPTLSDGYCFFNLFGEWQQAFGYHPPRAEALEPLRSLAHKIAGYDADDTLRMYAEPEWISLCQMRGPFEGLTICRCESCHAESPLFHQSGFDDRFPFVCLRCGDVWLQSGYDSTPLPPCGCGGQLGSLGCPFCGSVDRTRVSDGSSYQYFATHRLHEKA